MDLDPEIVARIKKLEEKYAVMGQDLRSYLDGQLYADYLTYWDYIHLDTLLSLQHPKTSFPDEHVFIMYHQITELYFKLTLHELEQIANNGRNVKENGQDLGWNDKLEVKFLVERLKRINRYFESLTKSFAIMVDGMEPDQFLKYRMALLPASGFQSAQYRKIEVCSTRFRNLVHLDHRADFDEKSTDFEAMFELLYWKKGATELATGKKTLTLKQFEKKYTDELLDLAVQYQHNNLLEKYESLAESDQQNEELINTLRQFDINVNVNWPLVHYKSAVRYLQRDESDIVATGGTNWQKYLPPRFQKRIFYPGLWSEQEKEEWGKGWVESAIKER